MPRSKKTSAATPTPGPDDAELARLADELNLTSLPAVLPTILTEAENKGASYTEFALRLLRAESTQRRTRRLTRALKRSGLGPEVTLDAFDFSMRPGLNAPAVRELLHCRFVHEHRGIVCVGPPGMGKTHVCRAIGHAASRLGHTVLLRNTSTVLEELAASRVDGTYRRTLRRYIKPAVLILEEFAYMGFDKSAAQHLFRLVSERYERSSTIVVANTGFRRWKTFFPSEAECVATVDRLIDRATILRFSGKPFRAPKDTYGAPLADES